MARRAPETLADYLVVAICPTLIFFFVGSLMWFLVEVFYQGEFRGRLLWVMAMWVMGIVGIARISMEDGLAYASLFAVPLGAAVALAMARFIADGLGLGGILMILVWWATHKLVWDATLIDDTQDASGEGLLQHMGLEPGSEQNRPKPQSLVEGTSSTEESPAPWWERILEPDRRPHAPGIWVVYFSLAALPIFGIGGWFVSGTDPVARARTFGLLVIYVASGMGLLLATSFLGLRRYLRQRKLQMPLEMTSTWLIAGVVMICATLFLATILPRPRREQSLSQLPVVVSSAARKASRLAFGKEGTKDDKAQNVAKTTSPEGEKTSETSEIRQKGRETSQQPGGKRGETTQGNAKSNGKSAASKSDQNRAKNQAESSQKTGERSAEADSRQANQPTKDKQSDESSDKQSQDQPSESPREDQPPPDSRSPAEVLSQAPSAVLGHLASMLRWLFLAALAIGCLVAAWIYREELVAAWAKLMQELRDLWEWLFGGKKAQAAEPTAEIAPPPPSFLSYADPFLTGNAARMSWPQLVRYSFEALEAWGREQECPRPEGQTAHEFAQALAAVDADVGRQAVTLAAYYSQLAYAPRAGGSGPKESLRDLWTLMGERRVSQVAV